MITFSASEKSQSSTEAEGLGTGGSSPAPTFLAPDSGEVSEWRWTLTAVITVPRLCLVDRNAGITVRILRVIDVCSQVVDVDVEILRDGYAVSRVLIAGSSAVADLFGDLLFQFVTVSLYLVSYDFPTVGEVVH